ncbi:MAG: hypothetical protein Q8M19_14960 [Reyranella sp.]|nr:hypothetical protein [Reyranella sp.]
MDKRINIEIDHSTWPEPGKGPQIPLSFLTGGATSSVNVPAMLLLIGFLTTPPTSSGISLSEYWAWVRYLNAITSTDDLRISEDFFALDAHQKTILSDDFGMGIPMFWLAQKLKLSMVCDGRYFIRRIASSIGATAKKTGKRGPNKSPDFVALDTNGIWHIIECKGTQTSTDYRDVQLFGRRRSKLSGARAQKNTIIFPPGYSGQRLACGVVVAHELSGEKSSLKIIDPPAKRQKAFSVQAKDIEEAENTISRSVLATSLRLAGYRISSEAVASPLGIKPDTRPTAGKRDNERKAFVAKRKELAKDELESRASSQRSKTEGMFSGRETLLDLPRPIQVRGREINVVRVFQGVRSNVLAQVRAEDLAEGNAGVAPSKRLSRQPTGVSHDDFSAELRVSDTYVADIDLLTSRPQ